MAELCTNPGIEVNTTGWESNGAFGTFAPATLARTTSKFKSGVASLQVTWPAPSGKPSIADFVTPGHIAGRRYKANCWVWVPSGMPDVRMDSIYVGAGALTSVKDTWVNITMEYIATQDTHWVGVRTQTDTVAGIGVYIDDMSIQDMLVTGTWKSPLNMPAMTMQQLVNRGSFGAGNMPRMTMQNIVNRGSFANPNMPRMTTDMVGTVAPPRKILIDGVLKNLVRQKWPS